MICAICSEGNDKLMLRCFRTTAATLFAADAMIAQQLKIIDGEAERDTWNNARQNFIILHATQILLLNICRRIEWNGRLLGRRIFLRENHANLPEFSPLRFF